MNSFSQKEFIFRSNRGPLQRGRHGKQSEGSERLIADAKVFNPDRGKSAAYIIQGFRQIYQYSADYNAAVGYLIIFNTSNKQLRFGVTGSAAPLPSVVLNHKTIFFLVIDLYEHEASASKRPQPEIVEIEFLARKDNQAIPLYLLCSPITFATRVGIEDDGSINHALFRSRRSPWAGFECCA